MTTPIQIRLGLQIPVFDYAGVPDPSLFDKIASIATTAEDSGFDSVWVMDHFYQITGRPSDRMLEAYTLLGALAARTSSLNLGALVTGVTYRNPAMLAKQVTTLDVLSGGRAICGLGAAWNELEHAGYGFDFPTAKERLDRLEEAAQICSLMFTEEAPSFTGTHFKIHEALNRPRPIRAGGIPIMIGGGGEKRTLRLVANYADAANFSGTPDVLRAKLDALLRHCDDVGRDPASICKTTLRTVVVGPDAAEAARRGEELRAGWGLGEDRYRAMVVEGDPEQVAERLMGDVAAGMDGVIVNMAHVDQLEPVVMLGEAMRKALGF
jgi:F420-dependent oxidoreductase-like protein